MQLLFASFSPLTALSIKLFVVFSMVLVRSTMVGILELERQDRTHLGRQSSGLAWHWLRHCPGYHGGSTLSNINTDTLELRVSVLMFE